MLFFILIDLFHFDVHYLIYPFSFIDFFFIIFISIIFISFYPLILIFFIFRLLIIPNTVVSHSIMLLIITQFKVVFITYLSLITCFLLFPYNISYFIPFISLYSSSLPPTTSSTFYKPHSSSYQISSDIYVSLSFYSLITYNSLTYSIYCSLAYS